MPNSGGWWANQEDPRYASSNAKSAPTVDPADTQRLAPARTGSIWGALFQSLTNYTRFTGGLTQLWQDGREAQPLAAMVLPYSYAGVSPTQAWMAGGFEWRPKLSAFTNKALGAADADRNQAKPFMLGPMMPARVAESFAVPIASFWDQFPKGTVPPFNRQPGYVTAWPTAAMTYRVMGGGSGA